MQFQINPLPPPPSPSPPPPAPFQFPEIAAQQAALPPLHSQPQSNIVTTAREGERERNQRWIQNYIQMQNDLQNELQVEQLLQQDEIEGEEQRLYEHRELIHTSAKCGNPGLAWPSEPNIVGLARPNIVM